MYKYILLRTISLILFLGISFIGCYQDGIHTVETKESKSILEQDLNYSSHSDLTSRAALSQERIRTYCRGTCDCYMNGKIKGGVHVQECSCNDCVMTIKFINEQGERILESENSTVELLYSEEFNNFIGQKYQDNFLGLKSVDYMMVGGYEIEQYEFLLTNEITETVTFYRVGDKVYTFSCTGSCDCRERFVFSDPPSAECTCDECTMVMEEKIRN